MEHFSILKDKDIFDNPLPEPKEYSDRPTVKGLVFDSENNIALLCHPVENYGLFPGGGIEEGETKEQAFLRECKEEIGCDVEIVQELGSALQFRARDKRKYIIYFFVAKVLGGKGAPTTTQADELGVVVRWMTKEGLEKQLKEQAAFVSKDWYNRQFNSRTHFKAFKKFLESQ